MPSGVKRCSWKRFRPVRIAPRATDSSPSEAAPDVRLVFMRMRDGGLTGTNAQGLRKLWKGEIATAANFEATDSYTRDGLISALRDLLAAFAPTTVHAQDYRTTVLGNEPNDHADHVITARFAQAAYARARANGQLPNASLVAYRDYGINQSPANLSDADELAKSEAFYA